MSLPKIVRSRGVEREQFESLGMNLLGLFFAFSTQLSHDARPLVFRMANQMLVDEGGKVAVLVTKRLKG